MTVREARRNPPRIPPAHLSPEQRDLFAAIDAWGWVPTADRHTAWFRVADQRESIQSRPVYGWQYRISRLRDLRTNEFADGKFIVSEYRAPEWVYTGIHGPTVDAVHAALWLYIFDRDAQRPVLQKV